MFGPPGAFANVVGSPVQPVMQPGSGSVAVDEAHLDARGQKLARLALPFGCLLDVVIAQAAQVPVVVVVADVVCQALQVADGVRPGNA